MNRAATAAETDPPVTLYLEDAADAVRTDADRLRAVLVNLIANARESLVARAAAPLAVECLAQAGQWRPTSGAG